MTNAKKTRDSNMELLRIVAMLLVMIVHASYRALPKPTMESLASDPVSGFLQLTTESFSIVAVDVFIMLSGWYGIRPRLSRLAELLFQIVFFGLVCLGIYRAATGAFPAGAAKTILMLGESDYWFIKTYLALYLLSPVLNAFVQTATRRQFATTLTALFAFQWVFGWVFEATSWLRSGYSLPSFLCLYLLARYLRVHSPRFTSFSSKAYLCGYLGVACFMAVASFLLKRHFGLGGVLFFYNSPVVILGATCLLLFFSKLSFQSRLVNWVAISALSIYLTHSSSFVGKYYDMQILDWFYHESRPSFIALVATLIVAVFTCSILIDKIRLSLWSLIAKRFSSEVPAR